MPTGRVEKRDTRVACAHLGVSRRVQYCTTGDVNGDGRVDSLRQHVYGQGDDCGINATKGSSCSDGNARNGNERCVFASVRFELEVIRRFSYTLGVADTKRISNLGGWSLNVQHSYDPKTRTVFLGDGSVTQGDQLDQWVRTTLRTQASRRVGQSSTSRGALARRPTTRMVQGPKPRFQSSRTPTATTLASEGDSVFIIALPHRALAGVSIVVWFDNRGLQTLWAQIRDLNRSHDDLDRGRLVATFPLDRNDAWVANGIAAIRIELHRNLQIVMQYARDALTPAMLQVFANFDGERRERIGQFCSQKAPPDGPINHFCTSFTTHDKLPFLLRPYAFERESE